MLYTGGKTLLGVAGGQPITTPASAIKSAIAVPKLRKSLQPASNYLAALIKDGYGFADGKIKGPTTNDATNSADYYDDNCTGYTALTSAGIFDINVSGGQSISTNFCLTEDVVINATAFLDETFIFSGIIDGCGHTLTINCTQSSNWGAAHCWGALIGTLTGTIKNIKIITNFFWENSNSNGSNQFVGGIAGRIVGGTVQNVSVQVGIYSGAGDYTMKYNGRPQSNAVKMVGGCFGEAGNSQNSNPTNTCTIENLTIQIDGIGWQNTAGGNVFGYPDVKFGVAGCIGHIAQNTTVNMKNISVKGSGNLVSSTINGNNGGTSKSHKGALVAYSEGVFSLTNCKYSYTGTVVNNETLNNYYECSVMGAATNSNNFSITTFYYTANSYAAVNGYLEWQDTQTALFGQQYAVAMENLIGFEGDYLWIGDISQIKLRTMTIDITDIQGKYIDSITFTNNTEIVAENVVRYAMAKYDASGQLMDETNDLVIIKIDPSLLQSMSNVLSAVVYGLFSYVTKTAGSSANSFRMYYNNGSYIDYTFPQDFSGRVGVYDVYKREVINGQPYYITKNTNKNYYVSN